MRGQKVPPGTVTRKDGKPDKRFGKRTPEQRAEIREMRAYNRRHARVKDASMKAYREISRAMQEACPGLPQAPGEIPCPYKRFGESLLLTDQGRVYFARACECARLDEKSCALSTDKMSPEQEGRLDAVGKIIGNMFTDIVYSSRVDTDEPIKKLLDMLNVENAGAMYYVISAAESAANHSLHD